MQIRKENQLKCNEKKKTKNCFEEKHKNPNSEVNSKITGEKTVKGNNLVNKTT